MSGVAVITYLLLHDAAVTAVIPAARISAGPLPIKTVLPAIEVAHASGMPHLSLAMSEPGRMHRDRVQVTALFKTGEGAPQGAGYPGMAALLRLILAACPNQRGTINGIAVDSILPDIEGPDVPYPDEQIVSRSRDFIVNWTE